MKFEDLKGKTIIKIEGMVNDSTEVKITLSNGDVVIMYHQQDCCESVNLYDLNGDVSDLIGSEILLAEESSNGEQVKPEDMRSDYFCDCDEWTFYKLATIKGYVDMRWFGTSNGYYSTSVDIYWQVKK